MNKLTFYLILGILLFAMYGSFDLSMIDFKEKDVCPKLLGIPACYIVLFCFTLSLLAHTIKTFFTKHLWFFIFMALPFILALSGTLSELSGKEVCPRTANGIPMCFISLGICVLLILLKFCNIKTESKN